MSHGLDDVKGAITLSFLDLLPLQDTAGITATAVARSQIDMMPRSIGLFPPFYNILHCYMWPAYT